MAVVPQANASAVFDLKSASLTLLAVVLATTDLEAIAAALAERFGDAPGLVDQDPVAIDLTHLPPDAEGPDFPALIALLREHKLLPVAVKGGRADQLAAAHAAGLAEAGDGPPPRAEPPPASTEVVLTEVIREVPAPTPATLVVDRPLRSGQQVYARGGDVVVLAAVNFGA
ncbi:MAG TPA: septum site-determining protein MinC, partial [Ideonella sp.]|nr:septum site-determining protein MinC [Ideonella sp.]